MDKTELERIVRLEQLLENLSLRITAHEGVAKGREVRVNEKVQLMEQYIGFDRVLLEDFEKVTRQIKDIDSHLREMDEPDGWTLFGYELTLRRRW